MSAAALGMEPAEKEIM
ncbi:MAG: hypothetical protein ACE5JD_07270 [Candidatus Methylomirabilia bacterium]